MKQDEFSFQLIKSSETEGTLIVRLKNNTPREYYANIVSTNYIIRVIQEIDKGYFFRKNLIIVPNFDESSLIEIIQKLEVSGDLYEAMSPLSRTKSFHFFVLQSFKKIKKLCIDIIHMKQM